MMLMMPDLKEKFCTIQTHQDVDVKINPPVEQFRHNECHVGTGVNKKGFWMTSVLCLGCQEAHEYTKNHSWMRNVLKLPNLNDCQYQWGVPQRRQRRRRQNREGFVRHQRTGWLGRAYCCRGRQRRRRWRGTHQRQGSRGWRSPFDIDLELEAT